MTADEYVRLARLKGWRVIGWTATRNAPPERFEDFIGIVHDVINPYPEGTVFVTGACIGGDAIVARLGYGFCCRILTVVPADRSRVDAAYERFADFVELMPEGTDYRARNERIVALCDRLVVVADKPEDHPVSHRSGTWMTKRIGERAGKLDPRDVHVLPVEG